MHQTTLYHDTPDSKGQKRVQSTILHMELDDNESPEPSIIQTIKHDLFKKKQNLVPPGLKSLSNQNSVNKLCNDQSSSLALAAAVRGDQNDLAYKQALLNKIQSIRQVKQLLSQQGVQ